ncbi:MAG: DUF3703 domain-containing protein [Flavobacteriales bacterium]|nr:DUF3703 domain-containing protein [Flavobacteriales bacterium]
MKIYTTLPERLKPYFNVELKQYKQALNADQLHIAWEHLERAHILGQRYPFAHISVHWKMLKFGWKLGCRKEIWVQTRRLVSSGFESLFGSIPMGNPGGSNVSSLMSFPVDPHIRGIFAEAGVNH